MWIFDLLFGKKNAEVKNVEAQKYEDEALVMMAAKLKEKFDQGENANPESEEVLRKIRWYSAEATRLKKEHPDKAIEILRKQERLSAAFSGMAAGMEVRERIATVLYEAGRFEEAWSLLMDEYARLRRWELPGGAGGKKDFERNLAALHLYRKMRTCAERMRDYRMGVVFAMAEMYAGAENHVHTMGEYGYETEPKWVPVEKNLKRANMETALPALRELFARYSSCGMTCEKCWKMVDEVIAVLRECP